MRESYSYDVIHHVEGERAVHREHCFCVCHDRVNAMNQLISGAPRDDARAAVTACKKCQWAHVVALSGEDWRNDERYMKCVEQSPTEDTP